MYKYCYSDSQTGYDTQKAIVVSASDADNNQNKWIDDIPIRVVVPKDVEIFGSQGRKIFGQNSGVMKQVLWDTDYQERKHAIRSQSEVTLHWVAQMGRTWYPNTTPTAQRVDYSPSIVRIENIYVNREETVPNCVQHSSSKNEVKNFPSYLYVVMERGGVNLLNHILTDTTPADRLQPKDKTTEIAASSSTEPFNDIQTSPVISKSINANLNFNNKLDLAQQAINAVFHLHSLGIAHRDIKATNFVLFTDNQLKLLDFGWAKQDKKDGSLQTPMPGTEGVRPPEVANFNPRNYNLPSVDIWCSGLLLYFIFTGRAISKELSEKIRLITVGDTNQMNEINEAKDLEIENYFNQLYSRHIDTLGSLKKLIKHMTSINPQSRPAIHQVKTLIDGIYKELFACNTTKGIEMDIDANRTRNDEEFIDDIFNMIRGFDDENQTFLNGQQIDDLHIEDHSMQTSHSRNEVMASRGIPIQQQPITDPMATPVANNSGSHINIQQQLNVPNNMNAQIAHSGKLAPRHPKKRKISNQNTRHQSNDSNSQQQQSSSAQPFNDQTNMSSSWPSGSRQE